MRRSLRGGLGQTGWHRDMKDSRERCGMGTSFQVCRVTLGGAEFELLESIKLSRAAFGSVGGWSLVVNMSNTKTAQVVCIACSETEQYCGP